MQRHSCLTDLNDLRAWFLELKTPQWNLYRGFQNKMPPNAVYKQIDDQLELEDSWDKLERLIMSSSRNGGQFTVYVPAYPGGKAAVQQLSINMPAAGSGYGYPQQQNAGLGGLPGQMSALGYLSPEEVDRRIKEAEEKFEMRRKLEDMEAALHAKTSWTDVLMEKVMEMDPNELAPKLGQFIGQLLQPRPGIQLRGMADEMTAPAPPTVNQQAGEPQPFQYDTEWLIPALDDMRQHFESDEEFKNAFIKLAATFCNAPDFFKQQLMGDGQ